MKLLSKLVCEQTINGLECVKHIPNWCGLLLGIILIGLLILLVIVIING